MEILVEGIREVFKLMSECDFNEAKVWLRKKNLNIRRAFLEFQLFSQLNSQNLKQMFDWKIQLRNSNLRTLQHP